MKLANLKIGTRLAFGFAVVLAMLLAVAALGISRLAHVQERLREIVDVNDRELQLATTMRVSVTDRMIALRNIVLLTEKADMDPEVERIHRQESKYAEAEQKLLEMFERQPARTAEERAFVARLKEVETAIQPLIAKAARLGLENDNAAATTVLIKEIRPLQFRWVGTLTELVELKEKMNDKAREDAEASYAGARTLMIALGIAAVVLGAGIAWVITRGVTRPINDAVRIAQTVAAGDLTSRIEVTSGDETGKLLQALKDMNDSLVRIVGEVRSGTESISTASSQIAAGNMDLSSRTEQQAGSLEETASSMEELTSTVRQNAGNARQANDLAVSACEVAEKGGEVVGQVVETMGAINESARRIVDIIGVIDGIAFQTNILALNAAVEAARAGEQGRGFAVVAAEVRNLAQRSAAAAKEIKQLIDNSVEKVEVGSRLVDQAGATMQDIVDSVRRVTGIMGDITHASSEQTSGIEQVNQAIAQMDQATQQNAALVEEAAAAADAMHKQADKLTQAVSVFKLAGSGVPAAEKASVVKLAAKLRATAAGTPAPRRLSMTVRPAPAQEWQEF